MIRFNDVVASYHAQRAEIDAAIAAVVERGDFINGRAITEFEVRFGEYVGAKYCVGVSSGTSALHLLMLAAGIGPGDEVITSPMTFIASAEAITLCGATPVFVDIAPDTLNISAAAVEAAITPRTRGVLFVHLHGNPGGVEEVAALCERRGLQLFEDCAQAHGARLKDGRHVGGLGVGSGYSFFPAKNLGAFGDAGIVTCQDEKLAATVRQWANHGRSEKYLHQFEGMNARMDTLQAAVLGVKLGALDMQVDDRNDLAQRYLGGLAGLPLEFQPAQEGCRHAWHLFTVRTEKRDALQKHLTARQIETGIHYPVPLHEQPAYAHLGHQGKFPVAEKTARETLSLPLYPQMPVEHVDQVVAAVREFFA